MYLSEEAIEEFREIWKRQYGEEISHEFASARAEQVLRLVSMLARPNPRKEHRASGSSAEFLESMRTMISVEEASETQEGETEAKDWSD